MTNRWEKLRKQSVVFLHKFELLKSNKGEKTLFTRSLKQKRRNSRLQLQNEDKILEALVPDYGDRGYCQFLDNADSSNNPINDNTKSDKVPRKMMQVRVVYGKKITLNSDISAMSTNGITTLSPPTSPQNQTQGGSLKRRNHLHLKWLQSCPFGLIYALLVPSKKEKLQQQYHSMKQIPHFCSHHEVVIHISPPTMRTET